MASHQMSSYPELTLPAELVKQLELQKKRHAAVARLETYKIICSKNKYGDLTITGAPLEVLELAVGFLRQFVREESLNGKNEENPECSFHYTGRLKLVFYDKKAKKIWNHREDLQSMDKSIQIQEYKYSKTVELLCSYSCYPDLKWKLEHWTVRSPVERPKFNLDQKSPSDKSYRHSLENDKKGHSFGSVQAPVLGLPFQFKCKRILVHLSQCSIEKIKGVDAIVNAANEDLKHIGNVAFSIYHAAGQEMNDECIKYVKKSGPLKVSKNLVTVAGKLPYRGIIHSVGPKWTGYDQKEKCEIQLYQTIVNILHTADKHNFSKIAMPSISAGIYGVPEDICADVYVRAIIDYSQQVRPSCITEVHFVDINPGILLAIKKAYEKWRNNPDAVYFKPFSGGEAGQLSQSMRAMSHPEEATSVRVCFIKDTSLPHTTSRQYIFSINDDLNIHIYSGSITYVDKIEAIVCSVGEGLKGGKLADALVAEGGDEYKKALEKLKKESKDIRSGSVYMCSGGKMRAKNVLLAVMSAPVKDVEQKTIKRLKSMYIEIFRSADSYRITSLAMPLIGTGRFFSVPSNYQHCCVALFDALIEVKSTYPTHSLKILKLVNIDEQITGELVRIFKQKSESLPVQSQRKKLAMSQQFHKRKSGAIFPPEKPEARAMIEEARTDESFPYNPSKYRHDTDQGEESDDENQYPALDKTSAMSPKSDSKPKGNLKIIFCNGTKNEEELGATGGNKEEDDKCTICMDVPKRPKVLECGHKFCESCIDEAFVYRESCPVCGRIFGQVTGNQPQGSMNYRVMVGVNLPGYPECDTIEISYDFPGAMQGDTHPHPGRPYRGAKRKAFLPNNAEGQKVLEMLKIAFKRKLVFTIGESRTSGKTDTVTWNDIHHKTRIEGGPSNYGYPDPGYLKRVKEELEIKGITEADIERK